MEYRTIDVSPLAGALGAELSGADLAEVDDACFAEIHAAWLETFSRSAYPAKSHPSQSDAPRAKHPVLRGDAPREDSP